MDSLFSPQALTAEISKIVGEAAAELPIFSHENDGDFLEYLATKTMQICCQEIALRLGGSAYSEWHEAVYGSDIEQIVLWCEKYMDTTQNPEVTTCVAGALASARNEILASAEKEYTAFHSTQSSNS